MKSNPTAPKVELLFFQGCPNVDAARRNLAAAFDQLQLEHAWSEMDLNDPATPQEYRGYGSPTILVNGADLFPQDSTGDGSTCRLYGEGESGFSGVPAVEVIVKALSDSSG